MDKQTKKRDDTANLTAAACKVSARYVRQIVNGERNSHSDKAKEVIEHYNNIVAAKEELAKPTESTDHN